MMVLERICGISVTVTVLVNERPPVPEHGFPEKIDKPFPAADGPDLFRIRSDTVLRMMTSCILYERQYRLSRYHV